MTRFLAAALTIAVLVVAFVPPSAVARGPDLRLWPNDGPADTTVIARGRDFPPGATGTIAWGDLSRSFGEFMADGNGEFEVVITVPSSFPTPAMAPAIARWSSPPPPGWKLRSPMPGLVTTLT